MQEEVDGLKNKIKKFSKGDFQLAQPAGCLSGYKPDSHHW